MKTFTFTVDDNIRVLRELTETPRESLFDHPYLALYRRLHETYNLKIQLNLFFKDASFTVSDMTDRYKSEWENAADWLKLSFHSLAETVKPYEFSDYDEVYRDGSAVHREILRFAGKKSLAKTTTVHYCLATEDGVRALKKLNILGLFGLYGTDHAPRTSYQISDADAAKIRSGKLHTENGIAYGALDVIINTIPLAKLANTLAPLLSRERIEVMIHEQYFYPDYKNYQPDFAQKLDTTFQILTQNHYISQFFEDILS